MKGEITITARAPFHFGLFYNAMKGLLGREPSHRFCYGWDGLYEFHYYPSDFTALTTEDKFYEFAADIREWLDNFDIIFSRSEVRYGVHRGQYDDKPFLLVKITHPVAEKRER